MAKRGFQVPARRLKAKSQIGDHIPLIGSKNLKTIYTLCTNYEEVPNL